MPPKTCAVHPAGAGVDLAVAEGPGELRLAVCVLKSGRYGYASTIIEGVLFHTEVLACVLVVAYCLTAVYTSLGK